MVKETGLYDLLGVSPNSTQQEIQKAFRKLALKWHPDRVQDPAKKKEAEQKFQTMSEAFDILSDESKRSLYDRAGLQAVREGGDGGGMGGFGGMGGMGGLFDMFGGGGRQREPKPKAIVHHMELELGDFYTGRTKKLMIMRDRLCSACNGSGAKTAGMNTQCSCCKGAGKKMVMKQLGPHMIQQMQVVCPTCRGKGTTLRDEDRCRSCKGQQVAEDNKLIEVHVEKGMKDEEVIVFSGEGNQIPGVKASGDIAIVLHMKKHPRLTRKGRYLFAKRQISLADALCGFQFVIEHLDKRRLVVLSKPGQVIKSGQLYCIHHEGMPVKGTGGADKGDLVIEFSIKFPEVLAPKQQDKLREVLGSMQAPMDVDGDNVYEACLEEFHASLEALAKEDESDDDDDGMHGGGQGVQCAQQ